MSGPKFVEQDVREFYSFVKQVYSLLGFELLAGCYGEAMLDIDHPDAGCLIRLSRDGKTRLIAPYEEGRPIRQSDLACVDDHSPSLYGWQLDRDHQVEVN